MRNNESQPDFNEFYESVKTDIVGYVKNKLNWVKLTAYEKLALAGSHIGFMLTIILLCVCLFLLGVLALGLLLGELLKSYAAGFGIMVLILVILLVLFIVFAKKLRRTMANVVISIIKKVETNEE
jgi:cbb3-type cytochrome oxidase subunit 3